MFPSPSSSIMVGLHSLEVNSVLLTAAPVQAADVPFFCFGTSLAGLKLPFSAEYFTPGEELWCDVM